MNTGCGRTRTLNEINLSSVIGRLVRKTRAEVLPAMAASAAASSLSTTGGGLTNIFSYSNLVHAVSGAAGSVVAISVFYPLDTVRTRLQVDDSRLAKNTLEVCKDICREEGIRGLYLGWFPVVTALCCSNFVYFFTYNGLKSAILRKGMKSSPVLDLSVGFVSGKHTNVHTALGKQVVKSVDAFLDMLKGPNFEFFSVEDFYFCEQPQKFQLSSAVSEYPHPIEGIVNVLLTTPLWVANTRLKLQGAKLHTEHYNKVGDSDDGNQKYNGLIDCLLKIVRRDGVHRLWGGTVASLLLATNPAIQFMMYEILKRYFKKTLNVEELSGLIYFVIGALAKAFATVITYPLQVVQSRLRAGYAKLENSQTLIENLIHMVKTRGFGSLYKGMESKLLQTVLTAALMFVAYEKIAAFIFRLMGM